MVPCDVGELAHERLAPKRMRDNMRPYASPAILALMSCVISYVCAEERVPRIEPLYRNNGGTGHGSWSYTFEFPNEPHGGDVQEYKDRFLARRTFAVYTTTESYNRETIDTKLAREKSERANDIQQIKDDIAKMRSDLEQAILFSVTNIPPEILTKIVGVKILEGLAGLTSRIDRIESLSASNRLNDVSGN